MSYARPPNQYLIANTQYLLIGLRSIRVLSIAFYECHRVFDCDIFLHLCHCSFSVYPNVAKVGGLQSQGVKGEAVVGYRDPLRTLALKSSGFPEGETTWQNRSHPLNSLTEISG